MIFGKTNANTDVSEDDVSEDQFNSIVNIITSGRVQK